MGYIKEPNGVTCVVDKKPLTKKAENRIKKFIKKSKEENQDFLKTVSFKK